MQDGLDALGAAGKTAGATRYCLARLAHDMGAVFRRADGVSVLVYGRLLATGTVDAIRANDDVRRACLGTEAA